MDRVSFATAQLLRLLPAIHQQQGIPEFHDESAPLIDVRDEPVQCSAERCKFHQRCFTVLEVTPSAVCLDSRYQVSQQPAACSHV